MWSFYLCYVNSTINLICFESRNNWMVANLFLELLQISVGSRKSFSSVPLAEMWDALYDESEKQSVTGYMLAGIERLPKEQRPPHELLLQWIGVGQMIEQQNKLVNERCVNITKLFNDSGFRTCILKGQGNGLMYPNPLLRQSGDIDIWIDGNKDDIVSFVFSNYPNAKVTDHHIEFPIYNDVEVEVHYKPSVAVSVRYDKRFRNYWETFKEEQFLHKGCLPNGIGEICFPTIAFNIVFQMAHMMKHFFSEGLGMRHIIDYYYVLRSAHDDGIIAKEYSDTFSQLGMKRFACAVMWVLEEACSMPKEWMFCDEDDKRGRLLLDEIMASGNFGHGDTRLAKKMRSKSATLSIIMKNMKMVWLFPEEAIMAPVSNVIRKLTCNRHSLVIGANFRKEGLSLIYPRPWPNLCR